MAQEIAQRFAVRDVLLVGTRYDRYLLEQAGMIVRDGDHQPPPARAAWRHAPRVSLCHSLDEAKSFVASRRPCDLVITDHLGRELDGFAVGRELHRIRPELDVALISSDPRLGAPGSELPERHDVDHLFIWTGNLELVRRVVQLVEDQRNAPADIGERGCRWVLLVEDEAGFYSRYLCIIYDLMERCMRDMMVETPGNGIPEYRPRLLMATDFEEAVALFGDYIDRLIGVISDLCFPVAGTLEERAGLQLLDVVKALPWDIPVIIQSMERGVQIEVEMRRATFIAKNAPDLLSALRWQLVHYFGFGDFVFRLPDGQEVARAHTVEELRECIAWVPERSLVFHARSRHFSNWLALHGRFELAEAIRPVDGPDHQLRQLALEAIQP